MSDEYNMENERRVHTLITEVATLRENVRSNKENFDDLKRGQAEIQATVTKIMSLNEMNNATFKYSVDSQIASSLAPIKAEIAILREESLIRKTQIALFSTLGGGLGASVVAIAGFVMKWWGN